MAKFEISLPASTLQLSSTILMQQIHSANTRVTLDNGDQYTLAELLDESVDLIIVNETIMRERQDARHNPRT